MNIKYKIIEVYPEQHSFVVRYYTDKIAEEHLCRQFNEDGSPLLSPSGGIARCTYDLNISIYDTFPAPTGAELHTKIMLHAPTAALGMEEALIDPLVDTSLPGISGLIGIEYLA